MSTKAQFSTAEAAKYLGISVQTVKYHIYKSQRLKPDGKIGPALRFSRATLDRFKNGGRRKK